jgi:hypothetical protein
MLGQDILLSLRTTDIGSFPLQGIDIQRYTQGAADLEDAKDTSAATYFVEWHNNMFRRKLSALGPDNCVPCYIQSSYDRDMVTQFLDPIVRNGRGLTKTGSDFIWDGNPIQLSAQYAQIGELKALELGAKQLCEEFALDFIGYRACVTGPLELTLRIWRGMGISPRYDETLTDAFTPIAHNFMQNAAITTKYMKPVILTLDEPSTGVTGVGDFFTDSPADPHLSHLISCWNKIYSTIPKNCYRGLHLHASPFQELAQAHWNLLEAHSKVIVNPNWLNELDRFLRVAIMRTDGPTFSPQADLKEAWDNIMSGAFHLYLQSTTSMHSLLKTAIKRYGVDRIPFAGPECGLGSWDWTYGDDMVIANLERVREVVAAFNGRKD